MSARQPVPRGKHSKIVWSVKQSDVGGKTWFKENETTFPAAANVAMRLALSTANFCMERNTGAEKEDGKCSQLEDGKSRALQAPLAFPILKVVSEF